MYNTIFLSGLIFVLALLYSSVGQAGASGYLAAMALFGLAPEVMKPTALFLNILVSSIATVRFYQAGCFSWTLFWPFAVSSIPFAFLGGALFLPSPIYKQVVGLVLLFAAYQLFRYKQAGTTNTTKPISIPLSIICGAGIGLLAGLTGVGGGIFLVPLLLFMGWSETKSAAGVSATFILVNSIAGISGHLTSVKFLPNGIFFWALAAIAGGIVGSGLGSRRLGNITLRRILGVVLVIAGLKMILV